MKTKKIPVFNVILWNYNLDHVDYYNIMPYLVDCWKYEKRKRHKTWDLYHKYSEEDTRMPETFDEFRDFVNAKCRYQFWARCEYEIIVCGWPTRRNEVKIDAYEQIAQNIDVVTELFMSYIIIH